MVAVIRLGYFYRTERSTITVMSLDS